MRGTTSNRAMTLDQMQRWGEWRASHFLKMWNDLKIRPDGMSEWEVTRDRFRILSELWMRIESLETLLLERPSSFHHGYDWTWKPLISVCVGWYAAPEEENADAQEVLSSDLAYMTVISYLDYVASIPRCRKEARQWERFDLSSEVEAFLQREKKV
jgi:hypothetical protein